jgi:hypothetical protein
MLLPGLGAVLEYGYLPGNDRVFSYELPWEPMVESAARTRTEAGVIVFSRPLHSRLMMLGWLKRSKHGTRMSAPTWRVFHFPRAGRKSGSRSFAGIVEIYAGAPRRKSASDKLVI